jgi:YHS domain-containing protein
MKQRAYGGSMKKGMTVMLAVMMSALLISTIGCTSPHQMAGGPQTVCPIMGSAIDKTLYVDYEGKRIYVCCNYCLKKLKKDPERYLKQLESEGVVLEKTAPEAGSVPGAK